MARSLNLSGSGSLAPRGPGLQRVPMGDISVIPQAWTMRRPYLFSNPSIIDCGAADPPTIIVCSVFRFHLPGLQSSWSRMASQTVGTPAVSVTCSSARRFRTLTGPRCGPGKTCLAPTIVAGDGRAPAVTGEHGPTGRPPTGVAGPQ